MANPTAVLDESPATFTVDEVTVRPVELNKDRGYIIENLGVDSANATSTGVLYVTFENRKHPQKFPAATPAAGADSKKVILPPGKLVVLSPGLYRMKMLATDEVQVNVSQGPPTMQWH